MDTPVTRHDPLYPLGSSGVDQAADGREALANAISSRPDIIVTDTSLPGINRATDTARRTHTLNKAHKRGDTTRPPLSPPVNVCPFPDRPLTYRRSHVGGVSRKHAEQWDYFDCESGCGTFQYRARTRKLRKVV